MITFTESREEKIYEILQAIAYLDREEVQAFLTGRDNYVSIMGRSYREIEADQKLADDMTLAVRQYKIRLQKELDKI